MALPASVETEIATLAAAYGRPRRVTVTLDGPLFDPLTKPDRYGEVCMVVQRRNGCLLTAIKTFYPAGCYRLLTGGVAHGESIEAALRREVAEETGLHVAIRRFLAVVEYLPAPFATFAFLLDEIGGELAVCDPEEQIDSFREIAVADLPALAATLDAAPDAEDANIGGNWRAWGRFRAVVHRVVHEVLTGENPPQGAGGSSNGK